ncbi:MAG: bifunctional nuclease family protein [Simkaniaceae bacterium]|nr:bifunctional nuclease family protein [Simkaniaceae bacterium]
MSKLIPITLNKIMQSTVYTMFILGNEEKQFAIYTEPHVGQNLQLMLMKQPKERPNTHALMLSLFEPLNIQVIQVVINQVEDTIYFARLFLEQNQEGHRKILEIDARPSDALSLALYSNAPMYCTQALFETTLPINI